MNHKLLLATLLGFVLISGCAVQEGDPAENTTTVTENFSLAENVQTENAVITNSSFEITINKPTGCHEVRQDISYNDEAGRGEIRLYVGVPEENQDEICTQAIEPETIRANIPFESNNAVIIVNGEEINHSTTSNDKISNLNINLGENTYNFTYSLPNPGYDINVSKSVENGIATVFVQEYQRENYSQGNIGVPQVIVERQVSGQIEEDVRDIRIITNQR